MLSIYTCYKCKKCKKEFILLTDEVQVTSKYGGYLTCPHCSCKNIILEQVTDDLRECMKARKYKREKGAIKQK